MGRIGLNKGGYVGGFRLPFQFNLPLHVYCFQRKTRNDEIPEHVMSFYFQNHIISLPLPGDVRHLRFRGMMPPPYFPVGTVIYNSMLRPFLRDLSATTEISDEEENVIIQFDQADLNDATCYDPLTDKIEKKPHDPSNMKYMILTKEGVSVDPKEFSKFIREQMG